MKPVEICWGAPNSPTGLSRQRAEVHHIVRTCGGDILFNKYFSDCQHMPQWQRYNPTKLCDGAQMANFYVLYFQQAAYSTFQTCILNSHYDHIICGSMADIQSVTTQNRKKKPQWQNIMTCPLLHMGSQNKEVQHYKSNITKTRMTVAGTNKEYCTRNTAGEKPQHYQWLQQSRIKFLITRRSNSFNIFYPTKRHSPPASLVEQKGTYN